LQITLLLFHPSVLVHLDLGRHLLCLKNGIALGAVQNDTARIKNYIKFQEKFYKKLIAGV
jgi:hypothetical protein